MREVAKGDRAVPLVMSVHTLLAAVVYATAHGRGTDTFVSPAVPVVFTIAAVALAAFALTFRLPTLAWSGALSTTAYLMRAGDLALGILQHQSQVPNIRAILGVATWVMLAGGTAYLWLRVFHPLVSWRSPER